MTDLQGQERGNEADYVLGTIEGWDAFDVVRWRSVEAIDEPFRYEIVLMRKADRGPVELDSLVDTGATFCIATEARWRQVHGILSHAELIDMTAEQALYKIELAPHLVRASYRNRCRTFTDKSLKDIVSFVLENSTEARGLSTLPGDPAAPAAPNFGAEFREPIGAFRWALSDEARVATRRRFVVQYNESDFDFVSRLLEAEGISYFFEHADCTCVMTLSDCPGHAPLFPRDQAHELVSTIVGGAARGQEVVRLFRSRRRLRPQRVTMRDYAWRKSLLRIEVSQGGDAGAGLEHFEFPAHDEDDGSPAVAPAAYLRERFQAEQHLSEGVSTVRTHEPGYRFTLNDRAGVRATADLLVVRAEAHAVALMPESEALDFEPVGLTPRAGTEPFYEVAFEALPVNIPFRPRRKTGKPQISGVQPARVTAEEVAGDAPPPELNSDEFGRVRVRFPWDQRENDNTPTSKWIRVSQYWAGPGFGALYVPRVGHEVLVAFERGDPDRPIIVGRVYNAQNPPPYNERNTTISTIKSNSVGEDGSSAEGFNEFRFEDAATKEQVFLHCQRNLDEVVRASHTTTVGGSQTNTVGADQTNTVFGSRTHHVHGTELVKVDSNRTTEFGANETHAVVGHRVTSIGVNDTLAVGSDHSVNVGAHQRTEVESTRSVTVGDAQNIKVGASEHYTVGAGRAVHVTGAWGNVTTGQYANVAADHRFRSASCKFDESASFEVSAGAAKLTMKSGNVTISNGAGAIVALVGGTIIALSGDFYSNSGSHKLGSKGQTDLNSGGDTNIKAGGNINGDGSLIKLN